MRMISAARLLLCASLLTAFGSGLAFAQGTKVTRDTREANDSERDQPQERAKWFMRGRTVNGRPAPELLHKAYGQKLNNRRLHAARAKASSTQTQTSSESSSTATQGTVNPFFVPGTSAPSWTPLGPSPSGSASVGDLNQDYGPLIGRTTVVTVDQNDATGNTVYIGGAAGGLWKSTNAADANVQSCSTVSISSAPYCAPNVTWTPLIDQQAALTVGAMAIQPANPQRLIVGTGEANNSADSFYGLGFLVSPDGGSTWSLVSAAKSADGTSSIDLHGLGTTRLAFSSDTPSTVVATMAATAGGLNVGAEFAGSTARGIYFSKDAGVTWQRATVCDASNWTPPACPAGSVPDAGSANSVLYNPSTHLFYANIRYHGVYSSSDGQYWTRLATQPGGALLSSAACPATPFSSGCPLYRAEMTIVPGRNEMYIWVINSSEADQGLFQSVDGGGSWTQISTSGITNCGDGAGGACGTSQGTYNLNLLAVPNGSTTDLYAGTVNEYRCNINPSNLTCNNTPFANLTHTYYGCLSYIDTSVGGFAHVHPDQHGIDYVHANPDIVYFGNDGGIYRTLKSQSGTPATATCTAQLGPQAWIKFDNLSGNMGSMMQTVWFSQHPSDPSVLLAGTQDNGTMAKNSSSSMNVYGASWQSVNNGDGGFNDINAVSPQEWFVSNPNLSIQQCSNGTGITCTANSFNEIVNSAKLSGDSSSFYPPYMLDPQATTHLLVGTCRLWRVDRSSNLATTWPGTAALTYNLDQFATAGTNTCSSTAVNMVSAIAAGGPCKGVCNSGTNGSGNGSQVIYVGTEGGKLFVTTNADGGASTWVDRSNGLNNTTGCSGTGCTISGIAIDKSDATGNTAYVTVMGFKTGHVFKTTNAGATWTNIDGDPNSTGLPDSPADAVALDPNTAGLIYVGTDVGIFKSAGDGTWTEVGPTTGSGALPNVAVTAVRTFGTGSNTRLRVSTYGRGQWELPIPNTPGFQMTLPASVSGYVAQSTIVTGAIVPFNGYVSPVAIQCTTVPANVTCAPPANVNTSSGTAQNFSVTLSASVAGDYDITITAAGTDVNHVTQQQTLTFHATLPVGLAMSSPSPATSVTNGTATTNFTLTAQNGFSGSVTLACTGLPSGAGPCTFSPANPSLAVNGTSNVQVTIPAGTTIAGVYPFTITATSPNSQPASVAASLIVMEFSLTTPASKTFAPGLPATFTATLAGNPVFIGPVQLSCNVSAGTGTSTTGCTFLDPNTLQDASTVTLSQTASSVPVKVTISTPSSAVSGTVTITAKGNVGVLGVPTHQQTVTLTAQAGNTLVVTNTSPITPFVAKLGQQLSAAVSIQSNYTGSVGLSCSLTQPAAGSSSCTVNPPGPINVSAGTTTAVNVLVTTLGSLAANSTAVVTATDVANGSISAQSDPFNYSVTDYAVSAGPASPILPGGSTTSTVSLQGKNAYSGTINASCAVGSAPVSCSLSPAGPYSVNGSASVPVTATISGPGSTNTTASGNYNLTITTSDAAFPALTHSANVAVVVQDYKLQLDKLTASLPAGQSATFVVTPVAQAGGFSGNITFNTASICTGLPSKAACTVNGQSSGSIVVPAGTAVQVVISTTAATTASTRPIRNPNAPLFAFWTVFPGLAGLVLVGAPRLPGFGRRGILKKRSTWMLLGFTVVLLIAMTACGGGGGGSTTTPTPIPVPGTPAGTYTVTVNSTAGSGSTTMTRTSVITLMVQ